MSDGHSACLGSSIRSRGDGYISLRDLLLSFSLHLLCDVIPKLTWRLGHVCGDELRETKRYVHELRCSKVVLFLTVCWSDCTDVCCPRPQTGESQRPSKLLETGVMSSGLHF